jgi:hypothetical protein
MSLRRYGIRSEYRAGDHGVPGEWACWTYNVGELWDGTSRLIIALHGRGEPGTVGLGCLQFGQNVGPGRAPMALARTGRYVICSIQAGGPSNWSKPAALADIDAAVLAARTRGVSNGKYGLLAWSMGGLVCANKIKRDAARIAAAWTWNPAIDLDYVHSTPGHPILSNNATWTAEVEASFGSWAATAGYRVWDEPESFRGLGVPWKICHPTDDAVILPSISTSFVAAVNDPDISMRQPDILGGHDMGFGNVPDSEIVSFFDAGRW